MPLLPKRLLRFSVRTLLIAVTIFCIWLGWRVSLVGQRVRLLGELERSGAEIYLLDEWESSGPIAFYDEYRVSRIRKMLGDRSVTGIKLKLPMETGMERRLDAAFPGIFVITQDGFRFRTRGRKIILPGT